MFQKKLALNIQMDFMLITCYLSEIWTSIVVYCGRQYGELCGESGKHSLQPCTGLGTGHSSPGCFRSSAFHVIVHRRPSARCPPAKLTLPAAVLQPLMLWEPRWQEETVPRFFPPHGKIMCCMTDQPEKIGRKVSLLLLARHCWPFLMREQDSPGVEWCYIEPSSLIGQ